MATAAELHRRSLDDPDGFWAEAARALDWYREPTVILDRTRPPFFRWFSDGEMNTCHNALDRHADGGRGDQLALIYDSPVTGQVQRFTYHQMRDETARIAGALTRLGVGQRRPRRDLHAARARGGHGDARVRTVRSGPLGRVRGVCRPRARHSYRRCRTQGHPVGVVRHRGRPGHRVQAAPGSCDRRGAPRPGPLRHPAAAAGRGRDGHRSRHRLAGLRRRGACRRPGSAPCDGSPLHPLHLGHDGHPQGCRSRQRRACRRAGVEHAERVRRRAGRGVLGGQ